MLWTHLLAPGYSTLGGDTVLVLGFLSGVCHGLSDKGPTVDNSHNGPILSLQYLLSIENLCSGQTSN